jgi:plastocyanin
MSVRGVVRIVGVGLLGALAGVLPAMAGSQAAPGSEGIQAENVGPLTHYWTPSEVSVEPGGSVLIRNPTEVPHGIKWFSTPEGHTPICDPSVPVGSTKEASGIEWSGSCTFATAGVYVFYCTVHGSAMKGRILVGAPTTTTTSTTTSTTTPTQTSSTGSTPGSPPPSGKAGSEPTSPASPLLGDVGHSVDLRPARHGAVVHALLRLSVAGAGSHVEIEVSAKRALLKGGQGASSVEVGRLDRSHLRAGAVSLSIDLNAQARRALRLHGRLKVAVRVRLRPAQGPVVSVLRSLTLRS